MGFLNYDHLQMGRIKLVFFILKRDFSSEYALKTYYNKVVTDKDGRFVNKHDFPYSEETKCTTWLHSVYNQPLSWKRNWGIEMK